MANSPWKASLTGLEPPTGFPRLVQALWWEARGDWERAHAIAQDVAGPDGAWVHAFLHRREGDEGNAGYWYRRAGKPHSREPLERERTGLRKRYLRVGSRATFRCGSKDPCWTKPTFSRVHAQAREAGAGGAGRSA